MFNRFIDASQRITFGLCLSGTKTFSLVASVARFYAEGLEGTVRSGLPKRRTRTRLDEIIGGFRDEFGGAL
jgi:hypothetical protein